MHNSQGNKHYKMYKMLQNGQFAFKLDFNILDLFFPFQALLNKQIIKNKY